MRSSAQQSIFIIDSNFVISAFEKDPASFSQFSTLIQRMGMQLVMSSNIIEELRWYLRRRIQPEVQIIDTDNRNIRLLKKKLEKTQNDKLPQFNDLSNITLAMNNNGTIVSSDLDLIQTCEKLNINAMIGSSFIVYLKERVNNQDLIFLDKIYDNILSDEIRHSVNSQDRFDPVTRIKKIQEYAIDVLHENKSSSYELEQRDEVYLSEEENKLIEFMNEIEFEFPDYLKEIQNENIVGLNYEFNEIYATLTDLSLQIRISLREKDSFIQKLATRLKSRILYLLCIINFMQLQLKDLEKNLNTLTEIMLLEPNVSTDIFMDLQFIRMIFLLITNNHERLQSYYTEKFLFLCEQQKRPDISKLTRIIIVASTVIESGLIDEKAAINDIEDISLLTQLGYIFLQTGQIKASSLLLRQALYMAIYMDASRLIMDIIELSIVLSYHKQERIPPQVETAFLFLKEKEFSNIPCSKKKGKEQVVEYNTYQNINNLSEMFNDWFYIYDSEKIVSNKKREIVIYLTNPIYCDKIALFLNQDVSIHDIEIGKQLKIIKGQIKFDSASASKHSLKHEDVDYIIKADYEPIALGFRGLFGLNVSY